MSDNNQEPMVTEDDDATRIVLPSWRGTSSGTKNPPMAIPPTRAPVTPQQVLTGGMFENDQDAPLVDEYATARRPAPRRAPAKVPQQAKPVPQQPGASAKKTRSGVAWGPISTVRDKVPLSISGDSKTVSFSPRNGEVGIMLLRLHLNLTCVAAAVAPFRPIDLIRRVKMVADGKNQDPTIDVEEGSALGLASALSLQTQYPELRDQFGQEGSELVTLGALDTNITGTVYITLMGPFLGKEMTMTIENYAIQPFGFTSGTIEFDLILLDTGRSRGRKPIKIIGFKKTAALTAGVENARAVAIMMPGFAAAYPTYDYSSVAKVNVDGTQSLAASHIAGFARMYPYSGFQSASLVATPAGATDVDIAAGDVCYMDFPGEKHKVEVAMSNITARDIYVAALSPDTEKVARTAFEDMDDDQYDAVIDDADPE